MPPGVLSLLLLLGLLALLYQVSSMSEEALLGAVHKALGVDAAADGREGLIGRLDKLDTQIEQVLVAYHAAQKGATGLVQVGRKLSENLAASSAPLARGRRRRASKSQ